MRATALRLPLIELRDAEFVKVAEQYMPSYALTKYGLKASRVSVFGVVVRRYDSDTFTSIKLDDFTDTIDVIAFDPDREILKDIKVGLSVKVIGRVREGKNGLFIVPEAVRKLDFKEEMFKSLEIVKRFKEYLKSAKEKKTVSEEKSKEKEKAASGSEFVSADELIVDKEVVK